MSKIVLDFGTEVDMLNKTELQEALAEDARLRALTAGVKQFRMFINSAQLGVTSFSLSGNPPQGPASGFTWMIMNIGAELSAAAGLRVYLSSGANAAGGNRLVAASGTGSANVAFQFSKGQFPVYAGEALTFVVGSNLIQSIFMTGIEIPAERIGELLL